MASVWCGTALRSIVIAGGLAWHGHVSAQPALDIGLELSAPADAACPSEDELRATVEERVGSVVFLSAENVERTIRVRIARGASGQGFAAELALLDDTGRSLGARSVETTEDCAALEPALVLVISTLVGIAREPEPAIQAPEPEPEPATRNAAPTEAAQSPGPRFVTESSLREPSQHVRVSLGVGAQGVLGLMPGVAPLGALELFVRYGALLARLDGGVAPFAERDLDQGASASFRALQAGLSLCGIATDRALGPLAFCAGARGGALAVDTSGLYQGSQTIEPYLLISAGPSLELPLARTHALHLGIAAFLPVLAPRYYYVERDESRRYYHSVELGVALEIGWLFHLLS